MNAPLKTPLPPIAKPRLSARAMLPSAAALGSLLKALKGRNNQNVSTRYLLGQLAIVAVFLPLAYVMRKTRFYKQGVFIGGSVLTLLLALVWFIERAFDIQWMAT